MSTDSNSSPATNRISSFVFMIVLAVMILSVVAFGLAAWAYVADNLTSAVFLTITGVIAMTLSAYVLLQTRRTAVATKLPPAKVMTTVECRKCGFKNIRDFQRGDYVYRELEPCQKCPEEKMIITAIYKEIKEKEKTYNF
jgi:hypothetical protein